MIEATPKLWATFEGCVTLTWTAVTWGVDRTTAGGVALARRGAVTCQEGAAAVGDAHVLRGQAGDGAGDQVGDGVHRRVRQGALGLHEHGGAGRVLGLAEQPLLRKRQVHRR